MILIIKSFYGFKHGLFHGLPASSPILALSGWEFRVRVAETGHPARGLHREAGWGLVSVGLSVEDVGLNSCAISSSL